MKPGLTYHVAISVDIDRFPDWKIRKDYLDAFRKLGCVTPHDVRIQCQKARALGQEVFAPCDHHAENGTCLGHPVKEES